jgi:hypothetical protein
MKTQLNTSSENPQAGQRPGLVRSGLKTFKHRHDRRKLREQLRRFDPATSGEDVLFA